MKSIEELRLQVKETPVIDNIVEAIIFKSSQDRIPKSQAFLQQAFYTLKQENPELFSDFIFDESGITPFSDELDSILFRLEASTILATLNPTYGSYTVEKSKDMLAEAYKKFEHDKQDKIDKCAELFSNLIIEQAANI